MYGSSRLGMNTNKVDMLDEDPEEVISLGLGNKLYEMSNHLGNVLTVFNDIKVPQSSNSVDVDGYLATIVSTADYSPFGVQLDGRTVSAESYRYGFNGQEKDDEVYGAGNSTSAEFWQYDSRLGRRWNLDPKPNPSISGYVCFADNPIWFSDILGDTIRIFNEEGGNMCYEPGQCYDGDDEFFSQAVEALNNIFDSGKRSRAFLMKVHEMEEDCEIHRIEGDANNNQAGKKVYWNPTSTRGQYDTEGKNQREPYISLAHEMAHRYDRVKGITQKLFGYHMGEEWYKEDTKKQKPVTHGERYAVHIENIVRAERGVALRPVYSYYVNTQGEAVFEGFMLWKNNGKWTNESTWFTESGNSFLNNPNESPFKYTKD